MLNTQLHIDRLYFQLKNDFLEHPNKYGALLRQLELDILLFICSLHSKLLNEMFWDESDVLLSVLGGAEYRNKCSISF